MRRAASGAQRYWVQSVSAGNGRADVQIDLPALSSAGDVSYGNVLSAPYDGDRTVLRTHFSWAATSGFAFGAFAPNVAFGMAIVPPGFDAGTSLNPVTNSSWDGWMMHRWVMLRGRTIFHQGGADNAVSTVLAGEAYSVSVDIKAKRIIPQGSQLLVSVAAEATGSGGTAGPYNSIFTFRQLLLEK